MSVKFVTGDCRQAIPTLGTFSLVFADPPFNIGHGYQGYFDRRDDFEQFTEEWISAAWAATDGVLCLHGPDRLADLYILTAAKLGFLSDRIAWVNWHYRFGQCNRGNWIDSRCHLMVFAKSKPHTWNPDSVLVDSDRASKYADKRINEHERGGSRLPFTVWGVAGDGPNWGRVQGTSYERWQGHPNQLPEKYLERILLAYTNPGDRVLDPFCGSGTTAVVAAALGRRCTTIDVAPESISSARQRLARGAIRVAEVCNHEA
jgi:site-specific DNA-methyltransferase (adenine-specific)